MVHREIAGNSIKIYEWSSTDYVEHSTITSTIMPDNNVGQTFAGKLSMNSDGTILALSDIWMWRASVYVRSGSTWNLRGTHLPTSSPGSIWDIQITSNGDRVAFTSTRDGGQAWAYNWEQSSWVLEKNFVGDEYGQGNNVNLLKFLVMGMSLSLDGTRWFILTVGGPVIINI